MSDADENDPLPPAEDEVVEVPAPSPPEGGKKDGTMASLKGSLSQSPDVMLPIYAMTAFFGAIFLIGPLLIRRKTPNKSVIRCSIMLAAFFMWLLWFTVYTAQINPLVGPRVTKNMVEWIAHTWGNKMTPDESSDELVVARRFDVTPSSETTRQHTGCSVPDHDNRFG